MQSVWNCQSPEIRTPFNVVNYVSQQMVQTLSLFCLFGTCFSARCKNNWAKQVRPQETYSRKELPGNLLSDFYQSFTGLTR